MSKKTFDNTAILNELKGASLFFQRPVSKVIEKPTSVQSTQTVKRTKQNKAKVTKSYDIMTSRHHDGMQSFNHDGMLSSNQASNQSSNQENIQEDMVETVRKAVKQIGKEANTVRVTSEEKKALVDIVYTYKGTGVRTSENELVRVSINFLIEDYRVNGKNSILARVIERLND